MGGLPEGPGVQESSRWAGRGQHVFPEVHKGSGGMKGVRRPCRRARMWQEAYSGGCVGLEKVGRPYRRDKRG